MGKRILIVLMSILTVLSFAGCKSGGDDDAGKKDRPAIPDIDWEEKIYKETIFTETAIDKAMADAVKIKVKDVTEETVVVEVSAPDIGEEIIAWYDAVPDEEFSEAAMEAEIVRLIGEGEAEKVEITMNYIYKVTEEVVIDYPDLYYNQIYCGVAAFYDYAMELLYDEVIEMGEADATE